MSNLPIQFTDKVNSAELLAIMQQFGEHTYVDAELINKFRDALNELHARTADTRIVENTGLEIVGTDIIINELWKWFISSVLYTNNSEITLPITLSSTGKQKLCYLCANQENGFEFVYGPESDTNPSAPTIENNLLPVTFFLVTDGTVGTPAEPIVGNVYKKKSESLGFGDPYLSGENAVIQLRPEGNSRYAFSNPGLISIDGFGLDLITGVPTAESPYDGKDLFIENTGANSFTLIHDGTGLANSKFFFIDETNLVIPPGGKVWVKYGSTTCEVIFKSWSEVDLSTKADLVEGKVPASQLPSYVDDFLMKLDKTATPLSTYTNDVNGNSVMRNISDIGSISSKYVIEYIPAITAWGNNYVPTIVGTYSNSAPDVTTSNYLLRQFRRRLVSAATAGSTASFRDSGFRHTAIGDGFHSFFIFGNEDVAPVSDARCFCGFVGGNGSIGNVNPSSLSNIIGVSNNSGQANLSFIVNGAGSIYAQDLGVNFPANTTTDCYMIEIINPKGTSTLTYRVVNLQTNADTGYVTISSGLPSTNIGLSPQIHRNNGTTALPVTVTLGLYRLIKL
jgi:hypothetical protein